MHDYIHIKNGKTDETEVPFVHRSSSWSRSTPLLLNQCLDF